MRTARRLAVDCLLLFFMCGSLMAQNRYEEHPGPHVIKVSTQENDQTVIHYLSHAGNVIGDATTFNPDCIWISDNEFTAGGTNKNYYYQDASNNYRFLGAPVFEAGASLSLSASLPTVTDLNNPEFRYYFYRWDDGLGRGVQIYGVDEDWCVGNNHGWDDRNNQCWEVYWVEYNATANTWKLSDESYGITPNGGKFYAVEVTEHPQDTTTVSGGLASLSDFEMTYGSSGSSQELNPSSNPIIILPYKYSFTPEYTTYVFDGGTHNYFNNEDQGTGVPTHSGVIEASNPTYLWTISGDAEAYLSFDQVSQQLTSTATQPTLYYREENIQGDKIATLKLTVTYADGSKQSRTAMVTAKTSCQNPAQSAAPAITDVGVTVSWYPTAESYVVYWQKSGDGNNWLSASVGNVTSYTITGLAFETTYNYKVKATCDENDPTRVYPFTTNTEPAGMIVYGAIFGGGRMANVTGNTEVTIINCDSVGTIYGGNDIAGRVLGDDGSTITLGTNATTGDINIGSVYGGGNGYYTYDDHEPGVEIGTTQHTNGQFSTSVTEVGGGDSYMTSGYIPSIVKTAITVNNDHITVDSIFGGAKNAFLTASSGNGSTITINHGIVFAVFGGNNYGGTQGAAKQHVEVVGTKMPTTLAGSIVNTPTTGYGRDFGIRYLFGGGNRVKASTTEVVIIGGLCDTVFAGGNSADVATAANLQLNCVIDEGSGNTYGSIYTDAIASYSEGVITIKPGYAWDGFSGIYNVRTLFGGNNKATMNVVPNLTLTSGSVGIIYGGGNAGNMAGEQTNGIIDFPDDSDFEDLTFTYSTRVVLENPNLIADYVYGGCQMSDVLYSTWVEMKNGHVGTVYGGCNVSGDVGSTRVDTEATSPSIGYQQVWGATYVEAKVGGVVYKDLFAGSNGYYHCSQDGIHFTSGNFTNHSYLGLTVPTHNETHAAIRTGANIKGNVYAGGNLACVGFDDGQGSYDTRNYPELVGMASVRMDGGMVEGNVYGGGNMASIYGSNEVRVSGGVILKGLYGGNDCSGQVAEKTNRVLPDDYTVASDGVTSLTALGVKTYVGVKGNSQIGTVYGGGNGDYPPGSAQYCYDNFEPIQSFTFVDIHIKGGPKELVDGLPTASSGGHIGTVYGGGNGVTVRHGVTVFVNNNEPISPYVFNNIDTIFGGNNKGDLNVTPDIYLVHGQVGTVYGGCNKGAMIGEGKDVDIYDYIGSYVRLLDEYVPNGTGTPVSVDAKVTEAVYGGCRMNGVTNNSLVLVEGGNHSAIPIFGGSDISGTVSGFSRVAVTDGTVGNVYGGGNGNYYYKEVSNTGVSGTHFEVYADANMQEIVADSVAGAPICANSGANILGGNVGTSALLSAGTVSRVFGAGWGKDTKTTGNVVVNIGNADAANEAATPTIYGEIYGGSALGEVNTAESSSDHYTTTVNFLNGTLKKATVNDEDYGGNLFGGGLGRKAVDAVIDPNTNEVITPAVEPIAAKVYGKVNVNISSASQDAANCFIDLREANIFGCNNANGSPQDDVTVHVYKTAFNFSDYPSGDDYTSQNGTNGTGAVYAIDQVFGGGNQADYAPVNSSKKTTVYVHDCLNTIRRVFSGGNAAAATKVAAIIEGGRFDYIFGGGNGEVKPANIGTGGTNLTLSAGIVNHLFGGSNRQGEILGPVTTTVNGDDVVADGEEVDNPCAEDITEFFGGSNEADLHANVTTVVECPSGMFGTIYGGCNLADIVGDVSLTIRGGKFDEAYGGSKGRLAQDAVGQEGDEDYQPAVAAKAANIDGNVTLNLEGGTITDAFGGSNINGNITGNIIVNVIDFEECPLDVTNVYGSGNQAEYKPTDPSITSPLVNVMHIKQAEGVRGNVFGGGNEASVISRPRVNIGYNATAMQSYLPGDLPNTIIPANFHTYVTGNVFGGGNNITADNKGVEGSTSVYIYNGQVCQSWGNAQSVGIYGGCNTSGTVTGNVHVTILGGTVGNATTRANIHGGGFGEYTDVHGNVTVTFGEIAFDNSGETEIHTDYPKLYGDLYGGSALGNVNTNNSQNTEVNILNGEITGIGTSGSAQYGYVFGGGLGRQADTEHGITAVEAQVKGVVRVNIGEDTQLVHNNVTTFRGMANLMKCMVFGCNNKNGTPLANVYVDVYKTSHPETSDDYAIVATYGCGNQSDYAPNLSVNPNSKAHVYVHSCDNTINYVYGGGEASAAYGVETLIEGGRFGEIYGGGNGIDAPANIGLGGIGINVNSGHVNFLFEGSNHHGSIADGAGINIPEPPHFPPAGDYIECEGELVIDSYYFGDNEAEHYGDLVGEITCEQADHFNYKYVFAGSRWAIVYGDIKLTVKGGNIQYLFGGSKGDAVHNLTADVRRFPSSEELAADAALPVAERKYSDDLKAYMGYPDHFKSELVGRGGNIVLTVQGGTIGDIVGGCDELGNVEGKITVIIDEIGGACPLVIGNIYGASNRIDYEPINDVTHHAYFEPGTPNVNVVPTPQVKILKGTVGSDSPVTFSVSGETLQMEGNVFGGGNIGNITANPKVIVGESTNTNHVEIKGDVYGGGKQGNVNGNAGVIVVPTTHTLTITQPEEGDCDIRVTDRYGNVVNSPATIDEYQDLNLLAIPSAYGYKFDHWEVANGSVMFEKAISTLFTMGTDNASLKARFTTVPRNELTLTYDDTKGSVNVTDAHGQALTDNPIGVGAVLNLVATPADGYAFLRWEVAGTGSSVANVNAATTTFTMGTEDATLTAVFVPTHILNFSDEEHGTVSVTDIHGHPVTSGDAIGAGATLYIVGTPNNGYTFDEWSLDPESGDSGTITDREAASTTYTMGSVDVTLQGSFKVND